MAESHKGARKPPVVNINRAAIQGDLTWRYIERQYDDTLKQPGPAVCTRCHAYLEADHWAYDERRHRELKELPDIHLVLCPGCTRVERRFYEGEVRIRHHWNGVDKSEVLHLIHNEEARERITNPTARIALMEDRGDELYLLTTTQFLARRIGAELQKAYKGNLTVNKLPRESFSRVRWELA